MKIGYNLSEMLAGKGIFLLGMNFIEDTLKTWQDDHLNYCSTKTSLFIFLNYQDLSDSNFL